MGTRGPVGKRSDARTRRNKTDENGVETKQAPAGQVKKPPAEDRSWHPLIKSWYRSLKDSGQAKFYEPSDWQAARFVCHYATTVLRGAEDKADPKPLRAASINQIWSMMGDLMTTETARRRARVELVRAGAGDEVGAEVVDIADYQQEYG